VHLQQHLFNQSSFQLLQQCPFFQQVFNIPNIFAGSHTTSSVLHTHLSSSFFHFQSNTAVHTHSASHFVSQCSSHHLAISLNHHQALFAVSVSSTSSCHHTHTCLQHFPCHFCARHNHQAPTLHIIITGPSFQHGLTHKSLIKPD